MPPPTTQVMVHLLECQNGNGNPCECFTQQVSPQYIQNTPLKDECQQDKHGGDDALNGIDDRQPVESFVSL